MSWKTRLTQSFPCRIPIVGAPMADVSGGLLASETCRAGALGFLAAGHLESTANLEQEIKIFRSNQADAPLAIGFIGHSVFSTSESWGRFEYILEKYQPQVVQFFAPAIAVCPEKGGITNVAMAHKYNAKVMAQVGNVAEAKQALDAGVDCLIAQGSGAGGHGLRRELGSGTLALAAKLAPSDVPVLAAGGIVDGRGLAAALALGCDGVVIGTRLWASREALGPMSYKERMASPTISGDDVIRTRVIDQIKNAYLSTPWPEPYDSLGTIRNQTTDTWDGREKELEKEMAKDGKLVDEYKKAAREGNYDIAAILAGEGVGDITSVEPAFEIITHINEESIAILKNLHRLVEAE